MPTALIAEDEPLLAQALRHELAQAWPALRLLDTAQDGDEAVDLALQHLPDLLFLDIRMPGRSGLEAAEAILEDWPTGPATPPLPLIVFVTAYDQYAVQAFERSAVDYLLKPVQAARLAASRDRLAGLLEARAAWAARGAGADARAPAHVDDTALVERLRHLLAPAGLEAAAATPPAAAPAPLRVIQASIGPVLHMIRVDEVLYFEAADKYVRVVTADREALIRTSLRELQPQLPADRFWQIHRSTLVHCDAVATAQRDEAGRLSIGLRGRPERLAVSRFHSGLFKGM